jgi:hypothetical protein
MNLFGLNSRADRERQAALLAGQTPVVLMGRGHSGTRVLAWICTHLGIALGTSEDLATGDAEDEQFTEEIKAVALHDLGSKSDGKLQERALRRFQKAVAGYYERLGRPAGWWGWKFPETYLITPYIAATFPRARYLHLVRDGRDLAFKHHLTDDPRRKLGRTLLREAGALDLPHHLQAAISWAFQVDRFDAFRAHLPPAQVFDVKFEQLCEQPAEQTARLCAFLNLPLTESCRTYLRDEINTGKIRQYREADPQLVREVEQRVAPTLRRYGYLP